MATTKLTQPPGNGATSSSALDGVDDACIMGLYLTSEGSLLRDPDFDIKDILLEAPNCTDSDENMLRETFRHSTSSYVQDALLSSHQECTQSSFQPQGVPECVRANNKLQSTSSQTDNPKPRGDGGESLSSDTANLLSLQVTRRHTDVADFYAHTPNNCVWTSNGVFIPDSTPFAGGCDFKVYISSSSRTTQSCFDEETNTIFVKKFVDFAAQFSMSYENSSRLYNVMYIRALVCLKKPEDIERLGPVKVCSMTTAESHHPDHFLVSSDNSAVYSDFNGHNIVTVPLTELPAVQSKSTMFNFTGVYCCNDYSTNFVGKGAKKPTMIIIFSLLQNGMEIARDTVNLCCLSSLNRDIPIKLKRKAEAAASSRPTCTKRPRRDTLLELSSPKIVSPSCGTSEIDVPTCSSGCLLPKIPQTLDLVGNQKPDKDGYYTFTCKTKDRSFYNFLTILKRTYTPMMHAQNTEQQQV